MRRIDAILLGVVIAHSEFTTAVAVVSPPQQQDRTWQNYYANAHPYPTPPLEKLSQVIPELKGLQPAADQQQLPAILESTGEQVDEFFRNVVDLTAREEITEERLNGQGRVTKRLQVEDNCLILRRGAEIFGQVCEYRMDTKGDPVGEVGLNKGFFDTANFALDRVYLASAFPSESTFSFLGEQKIDSRDTYVLAFSQRPGEAAIAVTMERRKPFPLLVSMLVQGIAWIDKSNFQLVRLRTDLLAPHPEVGLEQQTTDVTLSKVQLLDMASPLWLPRNVKVYLRFRAFDSDRNQFYELSYRNEHHYIDYCRYRVSAKMIVPQ